MWNILTTKESIHSTPLHGNKILVLKKNVEEALLFDIQGHLNVHLILVMKEEESEDLSSWTFSSRLSYLHFKREKLKVMDFPGERKLLPTFNGEMSELPKGSYKTVKYRFVEKYC